MSRIKKIFILILIILILNIYLTPVIFAGNFNPNNWAPNTSTSIGNVTGIANSITGVIRAIGTVVSVIALALIGIKYVTGSVEEKAEYKKTMIPYIIGAVMLFAASNLVQIIYNWANTL